jgi:hypothetical protein
LQPGNVHGISLFAGFDAELHLVAFLNFVDEAGLRTTFFLVIVG